MMIVYASITGNVRSFVERTGMESIELNLANPFIEIKNDYILIVPTYNDELTDTVSDFIDYKDNIKHLIGFVGSGNLNFNKKYCFNAKDLSKKYNKPLIFMFEYSGTDKDIEKFKKEVERLGVKRN